MHSPNLPSKYHSQTPPSEGGVWLFLTQWSVVGAIAYQESMSGMSSVSGSCSVLLYVFLLHQKLVNHVLKIHGHDPNFHVYCASCLWLFNKRMIILEEMLKMSKRWRWKSDTEKGMQRKELTSTGSWSDFSTMAWYQIYIKHKREIHPLLNCCQHSTFLNNWVVLCSTGWHSSQLKIRSTWGMDAVSSTETKWKENTIFMPVYFLPST